MKKLLLLTTFIFVFSLAFPTFSFAQGQQQEEQMGKKLVDDVSNKTVTCSQLKDADFEKIGEYFMGKMVGSSHEAMNTMMVGMMGKVGEEQMHITIGKRMSNCEPDAPMPQNMMNMMGGGNSMMGSWGGNMPSIFGIYSIIFSVLILVILVLLVIWLWKQIQKK